MEKIIINESLAKRNKENHSFSSYDEGSETREYNQVIAEATEKIEKAKERVSDEGKEKLDKLLEWYKSAYANWVNRHNANGSNHVSWMISGPASYNMKKHNNWMNKEGKLWAEYDEIKDIESKIYKIINGDKIIRTGDKDALEKLKEKLEKAQKEHQNYKDYNVKARKEGLKTLASYVLTNSNARIRGIKKRIEQLEKLALQETKEVEGENVPDGVKIIDNVEANRLQIVFDYKPDADIRNKLKKHGFRWSPKNGAWQRYRGYEAERIAKQIISEIAV